MPEQMRLQVGGAAVESASLDSVAAADISMQAHDREWTPLHGHTQAVTSLTYTVDGMFMLSGCFLTSLPLTTCLLVWQERALPPTGARL